MMRRSKRTAMVSVILLTLPILVMGLPGSSATAPEFGSSVEPVYGLEATMPLLYDADIHIFRGSSLLLSFENEGDLIVTGIDVGDTALSSEAASYGYDLFGIVEHGGKATVYADFEGDAIPFEITIHVYDFEDIVLRSGTEYRYSLLPDGKYAVGSMEYHGSVSGMSLSPDGYLVGTAVKGTYFINISGTITNGALYSPMNQFYRVTVTDAGGEMPVVTTSLSSDHLYVVEGCSVGFTVSGSVSSGAVYRAGISASSGSLSSASVGDGDTVLFVAGQVNGSTDVVVRIVPSVSGATGETVELVITVVDLLSVGAPSPGSTY